MSRQEKTMFWLTAAGVGLIFAARAALRRMREYDLRGKTVLITGGSRGLGLVLGREFVRQGARVAICARDVEELERASADLVRRGLPVPAVPCDVTDRAAVEAMVQTVRDHFGQIDVLVNNAGVIEVGPLEEMTLEDFEETMKT